MAQRHLTLESPSFQHGETIPPRFTCEGENLSPELAWSHAPKGTQSFALIVEDPDAPSGTFTHWLLFDIPASANGLGEGSREVGTPGKNDFEQDGYGGPCPPPNHGDHRYFFRLHALDVQGLGLSKSASRAQIEKAIEGHVLNGTELMGRFSR